MTTTTLMIKASDILQSKILIVDDLPENIVLLERILRTAGYHEISSTKDSSCVCELHRANRYDIILLDLQMPMMDGFQVMEKLKEIETEGYLPVLVITAQPNEKLRALKSGAKDFISKPFDISEVLLRVYNMLEVRLLHLQTHKLYNQVVAEQKISERLLLNVLPHAIAERLKDRSEISTDGFSTIIADSFDEVSVLFADIVEFTQFSIGVAPEKLVNLLNEIFTDFDNIADKHGIEKIKTIGDAYMAAAGLPIAVADHADRIAQMALDMIDTLTAFNNRNGYTLQMRIGISSGAVVAGVIGKHKFIYDLWGDTVNMASRMESNGVAGRIQITASTQQRLSNTFMLEQRGMIAVKGIGKIPTLFLNGRKH